MNLYILNYNNYYNRIVKGQEFTNISEVIATEEFEVHQNINFNPNDGVDTTQILNTFVEGDYCFVCDTDNTIVSRWFVIEAERLRNGQYKYTLHRDAIADFYGDVIESPCFIEKATVSASDPAIFNNENMTFNQIKKAETLLKDATEVPWIVGYIARNTAATPIIATPDVTVNESVVNISDYDYYQYINTDFKGYSDDITYAVELLSGSLSSSNNTKYDYYFDKNGASNNYFRKAGSDVEAGPIGCVRGVWLAGELRGLEQEYLNVRSSILNGLRNATLAGTVTTNINIGEGVSTRENLQKLLAQNGNVIHATSNNTYFKVKVVKTNTLIVNRTQITTGTDLYTGWMAAATTVNKVERYSGNDPRTFGYQIKIPIYRIQLEAISIQETTLDIPSATARNNLNDAPYDMFAIPYGGIPIKKGSTTSINEPTIAMFMANEIQRTLASQCYDIQLLPYCPFEGANPIDITAMVENRDYSLIKIGSATKSILFWCAQSTREFNIAHSIDVVDVKIENECDKYRLVSPNYNGQFEFNAAKNGGVAYFNVDLTYKPYQPYIHVNPNFNRLYGTDYNDARGLICGGDFSLPQISDAWQQYQIQNKNYENIFNRQIESMELNNSVQFAQSVANAVSGTFSGAAGGALTGSIGGPIGAAVGGVVGAVGSAAAGVADVVTGQQLRNEAMDLTKDLYGYNLGNIKALPYSLTKIGALNNNNKLYPFLEYYSCTDEEKETLKNKLKYNGMTLMRIDKIANYIQSEPSYIKGALVRCESIDGDYHLINAIAGELTKGVFI